MNSQRILVWGMAVAGEAVARAAHARGWSVVAADDTVTDAGRRAAAELGIDLIERPDGGELEALVRRVDVVSPSPGVPEHHRLIAASLAAGTPLRTELDLAYEWEQQRSGGPRPMVTITGTDGKTTVTTLATAMVAASGRRAIDAGNTDLPLVTALDSDAEVFVIEATSFRLRWLTRFRTRSATWLNLAPDHLDWHGDVAHYIAAKARAFEFQRADDVAIGFADDPIVMGALHEARARHVTFGRAGTEADYFERDGILHGPRGPIVAVEELWRSFPHDRTNALAAAATVLEAGVATIDGVRRALREFQGIAHRIMLVAEAAGIRYYDDSKATTPHAAVTAIRGFDSVVLIAGGRNKALDLSTMAVEPGRMRAVVAIGDSAPDVVRAFTGICPVMVADSMDEAVRSARDAARSGDSVLLSPGCASFDWYRNYGERGDDFARAARELTGGGR